MSKLHDFLKHSGQKSGDFARKVGISPSYLSEIMNFAKAPPYEVALRITAATGGLIHYGYWQEEREERGLSEPIFSHIANKKANSTESVK